MATDGFATNREVTTHTDGHGDDSNGALPHGTTGSVPAKHSLLDQALAALQSNKEAWVATGIEQRIALLDEMRQTLSAMGDRWVEAILEAKGTTDNAFGTGEEWANFALILRWLRLMPRALADIQRHGRPRTPGRLSTRDGGQVVARVFPQTLYDRLLFMGVSGEVWMQPGITAEEALERQAFIYCNKRPGQVALVLGAGNTAFLPVMDMLHKLFVEDQVVLLKLSPINAYLAPILADACRPLIQRGFLRITKGDSVEGAYLCHHPAVDTIHLTGSDKTFETILFGPGLEGQRRKAERHPLLQKPITAELSNVTPIIIVPGPWSQRDVREQAVHLATWLVLNAGFNCNSERVIVQQQGWPLREALLAAIGQELARVPTHKAYYPGAIDRHAAFVAAHAGAQHFGQPKPDHLPWTLIPDVDSSNREDICFTTEAFCSLVAETALAATGPADFLDRVVEFANETLWGTLCATLIVHPRTLADRKVAAALERAITNLRYGTITVNFWLGYAYYFGVTPWGAFPGSDLYDIQSGAGVVQNILMLADTQKSVIRAPFRKLIDPYTIRSHRIAELGHKFAAFESQGSLGQFASILWTSIRC